MKRRRTRSFDPPAPGSLPSRGTRSLGDRKRKQTKLVAEGAGADLDINFYGDMGTVEDPAANPAAASFEERKEGVEVGIVPDGYSKVIICAFAGDNVSFTYTAGGRWAISKEFGK